MILSKARLFTCFCQLINHCRRCVSPHHRYESINDHPFRGHGINPTLGDRVDKVERISDGNIVYARKTIFIPGNLEGKLLGEATLLNKARHFHVVKLIETNFLKLGMEPEHEQELDTGRFYIITELADHNLKHYLWIGRNEHERADRAKQTIPWFGCLIHVVAYIHRLNITHKDIKPSNILIKGDQVLLNFPTSKIRKVKAREKPGLKKLDYSAPEVRSGSKPDQSTDIFSLGAVFLEMLMTHSSPQEHQMAYKLLAAKPGYSYAESLEAIYKLVEEMAEKMATTEVWVRKVLAHCKDMLGERGKRPTAAELDSTWSALKPSDKPLLPCKCPEQVSLE